MNPYLVSSPDPLTFVGGGPANLAELALLRKLAPDVIAVDGGLRLCRAAGLCPLAVIGDLDSARPHDLAACPDTRRHKIDEQDSTDFDKALRHVAAPLILGAGFLGGRVDHELAALNRLVARSDRRIILLGAHDVIFHCPPGIDLPLTARTRISLWPMAQVTGRSCGLNWPIDGIVMAPWDRVGTSNHATGPVRLVAEAPGLLVVLPKDQLELTARALRDAAPWPVRGR